MTAPIRTWTMHDVLVRIRELATDDVAPTTREYNSQRGPGLPGYETLKLDGHTWPELVELAGLDPAPRGSAAQIRRAHRVRAFDAVDAHVRQLMATAEPPRPNTWPLFGIPTRTEVRIGQLPDGTPVRVIRQYYSLR